MWRVQLMTSKLDFKRIEALRKHLLISKTSMAKLYKVSRMTYHSWCKGRNITPNNTIKVSEITKALLFIMAEEGWPNSKVYEMDDAQRYERLAELLEAM